MNVVYEDDYLLCINKSPGVSVQRDKTDGASLEEIARTESSFIGIVHRIDKPASGIVVFAKKKSVLASLNREVRDRQWEKRYWAIVEGTPPDKEGQLHHYLRKNGRLNKSFVYETSSDGTKEARLIYTHIGSSDRYNFLFVELTSGRHHQIRSQLAHIGCPIKGDIKYGAKRTNRGGGISLHAWSLELKHPVTGVPMKLVADPPDDVLWNLFSEAMTGVS